MKRLTFLTTALVVFVLTALAVAIAVIVTIEQIHKKRKIEHFVIGLRCVITPNRWQVPILDNNTITVRFLFFVIVTMVNSR